MNDFFKLKDGSKIKESKSFDGGGGKFENIPANTSALAAIDEIKWQDPQDYDDCQEKLISVRWTILQPDTYKNRKLFQKIRVNDTDDKKSDKARRMLAAIDFNGGGNLMGLDHAPTDVDLARALVNKPMVIMIQEWDMDGKTGNFVSAVSSSDTELHTPKARSSERTTDNVGNKEKDIPF